MRLPSRRPRERPGAAVRGWVGRGLFLTALACLAAIPAWSQGADDARILRSFRIIALGNEHVPEADPRIAKWRRPIRVYVQADAPAGEQLVTALFDHMRRLEAITKLPVYRMPRRRWANFVVIFTDRGRFPDAIRRNLDTGRRALAARLARATCIGLFRRDPRTNEIVHAVVIIPVVPDRPKRLVLGCIVEETTQVMGLPNDSDDIGDSIFNDRARRADLSAHDVLLLRLLYDPRITPGMTGGEALAMARRILPELRRRAGR